MAPDFNLPDSFPPEPTSSGDGDGAPVAGRRAAPRLRLAIPATFVSIYAQHSCILMDLSCTGARIALPRLVAEGQSGYIEVGQLEIFGTIVRAERTEEMAVNAMIFDDPISRGAVLDVRSFAETMQERERRDLRDQVRRWVAGEN
jgi:hypothetical protein